MAMRQGDISRRRGQIDNAVGDVQRLKQQAGTLGAADAMPVTGLARVLTAVAAGLDSICDVQIGGHLVTGCKCHGAVLAPGAAAQYVRHDDGKIELFAGGGGGSGVVESVATATVNATVYVVGGFTTGAN